MQIDRATVIQLACDKIIRAKESTDGGLGGIVEPLLIFELSEIQLERFAKTIAQRAAEQEREACAKVCEDMPWRDGESLPSNHEMARAIRARTQEQQA